MKKQSRKDFIARYTSEDVLRLVLVQSGTSADRTFLDNFWTAHIKVLSTADPVSGELLSGPCNLSWPISDVEREDGSYQKVFEKGRIYLVSMRRLKNNTEDIYWYMTGVKEKEVSCPALEKVWEDYTKPVIIEDEVLGTLQLNRDFQSLEGMIEWRGNKISISMDVDAENKATWTKARNVAKRFFTEQDDWDRSMKSLASKKLLKLSNEWLEDDDTDRIPKDNPITKEEFEERIKLEELSVSPGGTFSAFFNDDDLFWGHVILVQGSLRKGPINTDIQG